jgi:hypothetical protein
MIRSVSPNVGGCVPDGEEEELRRLREWLQRPGDEGDAAAEDYDALAQAWVSERRVQQDDEDVEMLRALGVNRRERDRLRHKRNAPMPSNKDRDRQNAVKRIAHYIDEIVDWNETTIDRSHVYAAWAGLSDYNVDQCNAWFRRGVDPLHYAEVRVLVMEGLSPTDLLTEVNGKTILQHLREGTSMRYCLMALDWHRKPAPSVSRRSLSTGTGWSA